MAVTLTFLIGLARFYVGVHTLNQIVYGWLWGLWLAFYFHFVLRETTLGHIKHLTCSDKLPTRAKYFFLASLFAIGVFLSQIATYLIVEAVFTPDPFWLQMIADKCGKNVNEDKDILNYKSVVQSGVPIFTFGAYVGMLFKRAVFQSK